MRKIIQIVGMPETENDCGSLHALCDDGTVWQLVFDPKIKGSDDVREWMQLKPIPQKESE